MVSSQNRFRIGIVLVTLAAYALIWKCDFVNFDDGDYSFDNVNIKTGLTADNIQWAWTSIEHANWIPLTWMSLMLDASVYGVDPVGFHATNLILHIVNALLLFEVLRVMTGRIHLSGCVALLFAVHPVHVESVAWVAERKDVLSMLFGLVAMLAYAHFTMADTRTRGRWWYGISGAAFLCSLLSKQMFVTLPCLLVLLDVWPLRRVKLVGDASIRPEKQVRAAWLFLEKVPFLVLTAVFCVVAMYAQKSAGAMDGLEHLTLEQRLANATVAYLHYLRMLYWPGGLAIFYPHPQAGIPQMMLAASGAMLGAITATAVCLWKRAPFLATGWFWFLGTLVPVIGLVQIGVQQRADRYLYLPAIGVYVVTVWILGMLVARIRSMPRVPIALGSVVLVVLTATTFLQVGHWRNSIRLWQHANTVTQDHHVLPHTQLACAYNDARLDDKAGQLFRQGLELWPEDYTLNANYGLNLIRRQEYENAVQYLRKAAELDPANSVIETLLGWALWKSGALVEADETLHLAIEHDPRTVRSYYLLGRIRLEQDQIASAREFFERALQADPTYDLARQYLAQIEQQDSSGSPSR